MAARKGDSDTFIDRERKCNPHMTDRIIRGTENYQRWESTKSTKGVDTYGRYKIDGVSCLKVAIRHHRIVQELGYKIYKQGTGYIYISKE